MVLKVKKNLVILASSSPRRSEILSRLGWNPQIEIPKVNEQMMVNESPEDLVKRLSDLKAKYIYDKGNAKLPIIAADTVVAYKSSIMGKPNDADDAFAMLNMLQGHVHQVHSGVCVIMPDGRTSKCCETTNVFFRKLTKSEIQRYIETGESMDKAGAYAIQGLGMLLVEKIEGSYFNVVGLPIERLSVMLADLGWKLEEQWGN